MQSDCGQDNVSTSGRVRDTHLLGDPMVVALRQAQNKRLPTIAP